MNRRLVDLTFPIHEGMTTFPVSWHPVVEITQLGRHGVEKRETRKLVLGTHTGTHCDAPRHFIADGPTIDQVPLDVLVGPAVVLDFTNVAAGTAIGVAHLEERLRQREASRIVLRFGWDARWGTRDYYSGHSFVSDDAARWLVGRGVRLLAMDTPMPDDPANGSNSANDSPVHKILLGAGVVLVEYLCNLHSLEQDEIELIVAPLPIRGGDGAPARVIAVELR